MTMVLVLAGVVCLVMLIFAAALLLRR